MLYANWSDRLCTPLIFFRKILRLAECYAGFLLDVRGRFQYIESMRLEGFKLFLFCVALAAGLFSADAIASRPRSENFTCRDAAALVKQNGAMVFATGDGRYNRFVAHQGFCQRDEQTRPAYAPTLDRASCFLGYICTNSDGHNFHGGGSSGICREGQEQMLQEPAEGGDSFVVNAYVCRGGRWIRQ